MNNWQKFRFYNPTLGDLDFQNVVDEVFGYIAEKPDCLYEVVVGCDSSSDERPAFPVALVILRKGQGGRFFLAKIHYQEADKKFYSFRQRILEEVYLSCGLALSFKEALKNKIDSSQKTFNYQFQYIHADVGVTGPTREMIKEVVGLIKSNGFEAKIKPESFAASVVADRFT